MMRRDRYTDIWCRVLFPGALNSEFTDKLDFIQPSQQDAIPTYRVMNQYGEIIDKEIGVETEDEEALQIYKNMVKRQSHLIRGTGHQADDT